MRRLIRHLLVWGAASTSRPLVRSLWGMARRTAIDTALGAAVDAVPRPAQRSHVQVFNVVPPVTVYIRASHCRVAVRRTSAPKVTLDAQMASAFGLELATDQDDAGVYIVAHRKPVVGQIGSINLTVTVPADCHLAFHVTPGDIVLEGIDGMLELPPTRPPLSSK
jgi:hypothetical protein